MTELLGPQTVLWARVPQCVAGVLEIEARERGVSVARIVAELAVLEAKTYLERMSDEEISQAG